MNELIGWESIEKIVQGRIGTRVPLSVLLELPCVAVMVDFDQRNHAHQYDLWNHCLHTVLNLPNDLDDSILYLAALLHDIGKPDCQCRGKREDDPNMHYYGHPQRSAEIVRDDVIPALTEKGVYLTANEQQRLLYYVEFHDDRVSLRPKHLRRHLQIASLDAFKNLMQLQVADAKAHVMLPVIEKRIRTCSIWASKYADAIAENLNDAFCNKLYEEYLTDENRGQEITLEEAAAQLGISL